nr:Gfo/Idh/MocA family oxidoreductase [Sphingomonas sp. CDS-1]
MTSPFGIGLVGIQPGRSWGHLAHVPAIAALPDTFRLIGVANTSLESATAAVEAIGVGRPFADVDALVEAADVDIVTVCVKVPHHMEVVRKAIAAGKHVYCEWPIGNGLAEAREMAALAQDRGVLAVAGTQARMAPAFRYLRDLVADGYVGDVLSATLVGSGMSWGGGTEIPNAYTLDVRNGAHMLTIPFGHTLSAVADVLGPVASVSALVKTMRPQVTVAETGALLPMTSPDQVLVAAELESGAPLSIHYRGGMPRGTGLLLEINGTEGDLQVTAIGGHAQFLELAISGGQGEQATITPMPIPPSYRATLGLDSYAQNVGQLYQAMASDLHNGTRSAPTFAEAVRTHQLIAAIEKASSSGRRVAVADV